MKSLKGTTVLNHSSDNLLEITADLVGAFLKRNECMSLELPALIRATYDSLAKLGAAPEETPVPAIVGAVSLRKSLASPDHILSMIDGKPYRTLKRHLGTHGMTPETYRDRYMLPNDYPMVAPAYAAERRAMAKRIGLGRRPAMPEPPAPTRRKLKIAGPKD